MEMDFNQLSLRQGNAKTVIAGVVLAMVTGLTANAGEILHFKTGDVRAPAFDARHAAVLTNSSQTHFIVQFKSHIRTQDRQAIMKLGGKILRYIPDDALLIRADAAQVAAIARSSAEVQAVTPFVADWKMALEFAPSTALTERNLEPIFIRFFNGEDDAAGEAAVRAIPGVKIVAVQGRSIVAQVERSQLRAVAQIESVEWVQPNPRFETLDMRGLVDPQTPAPPRTARPRRLF